MTDTEILDKVYGRLVSLQKMLPEAQDEGIRDLRSYIEHQWQSNDEKERAWAWANRSNQRRDV
tara:strand:+ start:499 stop:687 length:189 start_codon:yes stop_codon:yes gene_type:complete